MSIVIRHCDNSKESINTTKERLKEFKGLKL